MKLLVTGGTGFLGTHLVERLLDAGHSVRLLARGVAPASLEKRVEWTRGDLRDSETVKRALSGVEAVYHLAGRVSFDPAESRAMYDLHVSATRELLGACAHVDSIGRFILASTSGTTAVSRSERTASDDDEASIEIVGRWPYYLSKLYEERLTADFCRRKSIPLVILNPGLLLGPGDERLSSTWTVMKFLNRDIPSMPNGGLAFVDVRDAAEAFERALMQGELYGKHLMGVNMPFTEFFARLERLTGIPAPRLRLPKQGNILGGKLLEGWARLRGVEPELDAASIEIAEHFFYLDSSKAERLLGFKSRDPQETLFDTVAFLRARLPPGHRAA